MQHLIEEEVGGMLRHRPSTVRTYRRASLPAAFIDTYSN